MQSSLVEFPGLGVRSVGFGLIGVGLVGIELVRLRPKIITDKTSRTQEVKLFMFLFYVAASEKMENLIIQIQVHS